MSDTPPTKGLVAGKYELVRLIGKGGMGSVWEARHASLGTAFAIKFIEAEFADSDDARSRFDKEARAAATIQSKHAIQIYDHGVTEDGRPYIVMERLEGEPLDKRIERAGRLSLEETARIIVQVGKALTQAHERGIVHRDLKPENIFLVHNRDDDDEVAKVLDFGIAKIQGASGPMSGLTSGTKTGAVLGTPYFMSPEQARGLRTVDHRSDVWSLGVIAFKCTTGKLPFDGESIGDLLVKVCTVDPIAPSRLVAALPEEFDRWFSRSLRREPSERFASVSEQAEALATIAGIEARGTGRRGSRVAPPIGTSGSAPPRMSAGGTHITPAPMQPAAVATGVGFATSAAPPARAHRGLVAGVALVFLVLGGGVSVALMQRGARDANVDSTRALAHASPTDAPRRGESTARAVSEDPSAPLAAATTEDASPHAPPPPEPAADAPDPAAADGDEPHAAPGATPRSPARRPASKGRDAGAPQPSTTSAPHAATASTQAQEPSPKPAKPATKPPSGPVNEPGY